MVTVTQAGPAQGFSSLEDEVAVTQLPIDGALPEWLSGTLIRNGPSLFEAGDQPVRHWFDGMAMLHRFTIAAGNVSYANHFLDTKAYRATHDEGRIGYREFATDPCRSIFRRLTSVFDPQATDNASINVVRLGERYLALTETPLPVVFDPETLETLGYGPEAPGVLTTAHPHRDPRSGALVNQATHLGPRSSYRLYEQSADAEARTLSKVPVREPGYIHSFAMTERYAAITEFPLVVNPLRLAVGDRPLIENFRWEPERGTRIIVVDRHSGAHVGTYEGEAAFAFHHVNAWDEGDDLVIDFCDHGDAEVIRALYLDRLRSDASLDDGARVRPTLRRLRIDLDRGRVTSETLSDQDIEMPRINEEHAHLRPHRYVFGVGTSPGHAYDMADLLVKIDVDGEARSVWGAPGCYPGEPVFVSAPGARLEDDGVALSVVFDATAGGSYLLVLDASSWTELARVRAPHAIPFGLHGSFFADS